MIKGYSLICGKGVSYAGKFVRGTWFDDNDYYEANQDDMKGFGFKLDLAIGKLIRPIGYFWKPKFWGGNKKTIKDILDRGEIYSRNFFGGDLYEKILLLPAYHYPKRTVWNPWYALHWFVLRMLKFPWPFISVGTPWINFYLGCRSFKVDPFTRDITWCGHKERELARKEAPPDRFYALSLSISVRNNRR